MLIWEVGPGESRGHNDFLLAAMSGLRPDEFINEKVDGDLKMVGVHGLCRQWYYLPICIAPL
jgi:hypothetical protein